MLDNVTLMLQAKPPQDVVKANGKPFEFRNNIYTPKYKYGGLCAYETNIKNMRLYMNADAVYLSNSLHKFYHGNNYSDFHVSEIWAAVEAISDVTGYDWNNGIIKKLEYGCNVSDFDTGINDKLQSYHGKEYLPIAKNGKPYGKVCEFQQYKIKGYNKQFQVLEVDRQKIDTPLFRWEILAKNSNYLQRILSTEYLTMEKLLQMQNINLLAQDAKEKFAASIKADALFLDGLNIEQAKMIAVMKVPEIREYLRHNNKRTFEKYRAFYNRCMKKQALKTEDKTGLKIAEKFVELMQS